MSVGGMGVSVGGSRVGVAVFEGSGVSVRVGVLNGVKVMEGVQVRVIVGVKDAVGLATWGAEVETVCVNVADEVMVAVGRLLCASLINSNPTPRQ